MTTPQYDLIAEQLLAAQSGRPAREVFRVLLRIWSAENAQAARSLKPFARRSLTRVEMRPLGRALGLEEPAIAAEMVNASYRQKRLERALDDPLPADPGGRPRRLARFVTALGTIVTG